MTLKIGQLKGRSLGQKERQESERDVEMEARHREREELQEERLFLFIILLTVCHVLLVHLCTQSSYPPSKPS